MLELSQNIRWCRKNFTNYTCSDVAFILGVSINTVSSWECGRYFPSLYHSYMLASLFKCSIEDLILVNGDFSKEVRSCNG